MTIENTVEDNCNIHNFTIKDKNFVLDVNSGIFYEIDAIASEILDNYGLEYSDNIMEEIKNKYGEYSVQEALKELNQLKNDGFLFTNDRFKGYHAGNQENIQSICIMLSQDCNLECKYCYANEGTFGRERKLMTKETAKQAVNFLIQNSGTYPHLTISFFGGEPLLNFEVLKYTVEYSTQVASQYNKQVAFTVTTNGTLLNEEIREYFRYNNITVMLSLDGDKEINDQFRIFHDGSGSYDAVYSNFQEILNQNQIPCTVRGTFTRKNMDLVRAVKHLSNIGCNDIAVEPCFSSDDELGILEEDIELLKEEYEKLADEYIKSAKNGNFFPFSHFETIMDQIKTGDIKVISCGAGISYLAVSAEGDLYPCHRLVGAEDLKLGNISEGIKDFDIIQLFKKTHVNNKEECSSCWAKYICGGGCRAYSVNFNDDIYKPYSVDCKLMKHSFELGAYIYSELVEYSPNSVNNRCSR